VTAGKTYFIVCHVTRV